MGLINIFAVKTKQAVFTAILKHYCGQYGKNIKVNHFSTAGKNTKLGNNVNLNGMKIANGPCIIGDNFHSGRNCQIINQNHNYEGDKLPYDEKVISKEVVIEDNVWLGNNVIILGGVHIGEGAIIQAGAVVVNDIPRCAIAGGNPARVFKYRDIEHYEKLKLEGKFN